MAGDLLLIALSLAAIGTAVHVVLDWMRWPDGSAFEQAALGMPAFEALPQALAR